MTVRAKKPSKQDIRRRILQYIKNRGKVRIREVAKQFRISHEGARKQLVMMEGYGWVARDENAEADGGVGRPKASYSLTSSGDHLFPKAYDRLSIDILTAVSKEAGIDTIRKVLGALADQQVEAWAPLMEGKTPREKLEALRGLYQEEDPFMSVEARDGDLFLVERNCPFLNVALAHPALCSLSVITLERLLGHPVTREERFQTGHGRCGFRVRLGAPAAHGEFRFEAESA